MIVEKLLQLPHLYVKQNNKQKTICCDPDEIRTHDPQFRRLLLYPTELPDQYLQGSFSDQNS